jgi:hypothetical protein
MKVSTWSIGRERCSHEIIHLYQGREGGSIVLRFLLQQRHVFCLMTLKVPEALL